VLVVAWVVRRGILPALRVGDEDSVALHLERAFPELRSRVISAVQLRRELPELSVLPRFSEPLVRALIADAASAAMVVDPGRVVPRGTWRPMGLAALALTALLVTLAFVAPAELSRAFANMAGSVALLPSPEASSEGPPLVGDLTLRLQYPEYTGLAPRVVESTSGEISAVKGTVVQISARALAPFSRAELQVNGEVSPLRAEGNTLQGTLTVVDRGSYRFFLVGEDGVRRPASPAMNIEVETDHPPRVRILAPGPEVTVGERGSLEVRYTADDDFGLRDLSLVYRAEGGAREERVRRLKGFDRGARNVEGTVSLSVFDLGLRPGERIGYRLRVQDNDVVSGPKRGESATQYLKVYSPRERHLELLEEERRIWDRMVHMLGFEIVLGEEAKGHGPPALTQAELQATHARDLASEVKNRLSSLLLQAREDRMFTARSLAALEGVRRRVHERTSREERWRAGTVGGPETRLPELAGFMPAHVAGSESDVILVEKLFKQQKLEALKLLAEELTESHRRLKDLMDTYRRTRDPELKAEIEREMARLEERIRELRQKLAELFDTESDEFLNLDSVKAEELHSSVNKMREALKKGDLDGALRELERMAKELQNTLEKVDLSSKAFFESAFYKSQKQMEKLLDEVHEIEGQEREVERQTRDVERDARGRAAKELDVARSEGARRIQRQLAEVQRDMSEAASSLQSRWNQELAEKGRARARDAAKALEQGDAAEALDMAKRANEDVQQLKGNLGADRPWRLEPSGSPLEEAREKTRSAARSLSEAVRDLERLVPKASEHLSPEERRRLGDLGRKQRRLKERAGRLKRRIEEMGEQVPFVGEQGKKSLEEAQEEMGQAEGKLGRGKPSEAVQREQRAAQALGKLKAELQKAMKPQGGTGGTGDEGRERPQASQEPVKIPGREEHRSPKEFREDLLKAMKQGTPPAYRDLVRKYYEELVK
jgi:hypothetical protein